MASLKLMYQGDCRRLPALPASWDLLAQELQEMFGIDHPKLTEIGGNGQPISSQQDYTVLVHRAKEVQVLKLEVAQQVPEPSPEPLIPASKRPPEGLIPTFHFPECSRCNGKLSGREEIVQLSCGHVFCALCYYHLDSVQGNTTCPLDKTPQKPSKRQDLQMKIQSFALEIQSVSPLVYELPVQLMGMYEEIIGEINTNGVPCVYLRLSGVCPDPLHCRYSHRNPAQQDEMTAFEPVNMKDAASDSVAVEHQQTGTMQVQTVEIGTFPNPIPTQDRDTGTTDLHDQGSDALIFIDKSLVTIPVEINSEGTAAEPMVSVEQETVDLPTEHKLTGPEGVNSYASQANFQPADFYQTLRTSIREAVTESSPFLPDADLETFPLVCDSCKISPIPQAVYQCRMCEYRLCPACEEDSDHPHSMFKIKHLAQWGEYARRQQGIKPKDRMSELVEKIENMGFPDRNKVTIALRETNLDLSKAVALLLAR